MFEDEAQLVFVLPFDFGGTQFFAVQAQAVVEQAQAFFAQAAFDAHEVFFFDAAVAADELFGDAAVLGEYQQADGVDVEPAGGSQALFVAVAVGDAAGVAVPAVFGGDEFDGGAVVFFGLAADVADGFVEQDGYALCLCFVRLFGQFDAVGGRYFLAEYGGSAVYFDPALFDIAVGFAAGAEFEFGHAFGQADGFLRVH